MKTHQVVRAPDLRVLVHHTLRGAVADPVDTDPVVGVHGRWVVCVNCGRDVSNVRGKPFVFEVERREKGRRRTSPG